MLEYMLEGKIKIEALVYKMCHAPAICFNLEKRGFVREGYYADLTVLDIDKPYTVSNDNILLSIYAKKNKVFFNQVIELDPTLANSLGKKINTKVIPYIYK